MRVAEVADPAASRHHPGSSGTARSVGGTDRLVRSSLSAMTLIWSGGAGSGGRESGEAAQGVHSLQLGLDSEAEFGGRRAVEPARRLLDVAAGECVAAVRWSWWLCSCQERAAPAGRDSGEIQLTPGPCQDTQRTRSGSARHAAAVHVGDELAREVNSWV